MDALALARKHRDREIVFFGLGFETTMPSTALTILQADGKASRIFGLLQSHHHRAEIKAILDSPDIRIDGFLGPGTCRWSSHETV